MGQRILLVDDDLGTLEILKEAFEYEEFEVQTLEVADNIFNVIDSYKPHLILIDYILTGINGGEICHQIKMDVKYKQILVFLMSAFPRVIESLGFYNCDLFISKPFDLYQLFQHVNEKLQLNTKASSI